ncbi:FMN-dependent dehydrogenase-domain-containing protein [Cercophora samala]|uniref:FMN-dependent dehydrogenase-domain-containing protein n=1 Tax=Cercophora samala TaxID=330535 RepID=A0AA39Z8L4_9PEZI|nr:FMN-dependent dehydrogenase-domain-containing protein [Cercophora samala]
MNRPRSSNGDEADRPNLNNLNANSIKDEKTPPSTTTTTTNNNTKANNTSAVITSKNKIAYGQYQIDLYFQALTAGKKPITTTDPNKLEQQAREAMSPQGFNYVFGGAGEQATMHANRLAFRQWKVIPRMLRDTLPRNLSVKLFGKTYDSPVLMAPIGVQSAYHPDAETGVAKACAALNVPFIYSTASSTPLEEIVAALEETDHPSPSPETEEPAPTANPTATAPAEGKETEEPKPSRWFQLYWPVDDDITASLLSRARVAGCEVLVVTLDTFTMAWRPLDLDTGFLPFAVGEGNALGFSDSVFRQKFSDKFSTGENEVQVEDNVIAASRYWAGEVFSGHAHKWEDLATLRKLWGDRPIVLKGVLSVEDAVLAARSGVDGIIVSNHGGRQLDGAVPSLEMLPEIVDAVGDRLTVLFDSGIRTGVDVLKALALGAKAVLVGRPVIYGLGIAGTEGAKHVLASLLADVDQSMGLLGVQTVGELNRSMLRKLSYGGDVKTSL